MPVSVVVGGQFGSEGKGKVALDIARTRHVAAVVRTGGTNSGHTGVDDNGVPQAFRQFPASALAKDADVILPAGALIDREIFFAELECLPGSAGRIKVDPKATVISSDDKLAEQECGLATHIGSTASGTGAALQRRISRLGDSQSVLAKSVTELAPFLCDTSQYLRGMLASGKDVVLEGTQGFGLSVLHGGFYPKATSRDTTAAAFVSEAGLSPFDVEDIILVIRAFPIRVAGDSGPLKNETSWQEIAEQAGLPIDYCELTTATGNVRRVARYDPEIVKRAISVNCPTQIVLNHLDYFDEPTQGNCVTAEAYNFVKLVERSLDSKISMVGTSPRHLISTDVIKSAHAA